MEIEISRRLRGAAKCAPRTCRARISMSCRPMLSAGSDGILLMAAHAIAHRLAARHAHHLIIPWRASAAYGISALSRGSERQTAAGAAPARVNEGYMAFLAAQHVCCSAPIARLREIWPPTSAPARRSWHIGVCVPRARGGFSPASKRMPRPAMRQRLDAHRRGRGGGVML